MADVVAAVTLRIDRLQRRAAQEEAAWERRAWWRAPAGRRHDLGDAEVETGGFNGGHKGLEVGKLLLARPKDWRAARPRMRRVVRSVRHACAQSPLAGVVTRSGETCNRVNLKHTDGTVKSAKACAKSKVTVH